MKISDKLKKLQSALGGYRRAAICFSGGVDSTFLLKVAADQLGAERVMALLADTPSMPRREIISAGRIADSVGCVYKVVQTTEIDDPVYISNPVDRCYYCKQIIFGQLIAHAAEAGFTVVLDGNNADDAQEERPGHKAAVELGVQSPLMDAGFSKKEIRELSRNLELPTADKPSLACLATRVPTGVAITRDLLKKIERAEQVLRDAGFAQVRVRDYGVLARLEIPEEAFEKIADTALRHKVADGIRAAGYQQVVLDLMPLKRS